MISLQTVDRDRWCSRCLGSRCLLEVHSTSADGAVTAELWLSSLPASKSAGAQGKTEPRYVQRSGGGLQSPRSFKGSYDAPSLALLAH